MRFRADTLVLKFCLRVQSLPDDCLLSLLSSSLPSSLLSTLRSRRIVLDHPPEVTAPSRLKTWLHAYRQQEFDQFLASTVGRKTDARNCKIPVLQLVVYGYCDIWYL
ncbi:hypothetical protein G6F41_014369 [Rhizopus arrhizus]|nr:hypothetical protein G6F41_014369 [Rhizopus arrhizus]